MNKVKLQIGIEYQPIKQCFFLFLMGLQVLTVLIRKLIDTKYRLKAPLFNNF